MPKQRKLFTLSDEAAALLAELSRQLDTPMSAIVESLILQNYRRRTQQVASAELCRMVYDPAASQVRFEDMAGGVLAAFRLSEK